MADASERLSRTIWIGVGLVILLLCFSFAANHLNRGRIIKPALDLPVIGPVADFTLTNQSGQVVTLADLRGKVWLADIIFTRCPGPCARMTRQMKSVQEALPIDSPVKLVSLTTDPDFDTPPVLTQYIDRFGASTNNWTFLTGTKDQIRALAVGSLKLTTVETKPEDRTEPDDLFVHSTIFVLVDKQARLRMAYETGGEGVEWTNAQATILSAIKQLEHEP